MPSEQECPDASDHLPQGVTVRPWRWSADGSADPQDSASLLRIMIAAETAAIGESDSTADEITEMLTGATTDRDASLLVEQDGEPVAFAWMEFDLTTRESWIDAYAVPARTDL